MRPCCLSLIVVLSIGCATTTLGKIENGGVGATAIWDLATTTQAEARGGREVNPLMRDDIARWFIKSAGVGAVIGLAAILDSKQQPIWAHVLRLAAITINVAAGLHNHSVAVMRRSR